MKAVVAAFNQEKALVGAFSVIVQLVVEPMEHYTALLTTAVVPLGLSKSCFQGSLVDTLREVRPTRFIGVPRVYEKIHEKLLEIGKQNNGLTRLVSDWAKRQAFEHHSRVMQGSNKISFQYYLARKLIFSKVRILFHLVEEQ